MLWKAADQQRPLKVDITQFDWEVTGGTCIDTGLPAPQRLTDVINCCCKAEGNACNTASSSCHKK